MDTVTHPNGTAPNTSLGANRAGTFRMGAKGGRTAEAWQYVWDRLDRTEFQRGDLLATEVAEKFDLKYSSVMELLSRMRRIGFLEQVMKPVETHYGRGKGFTANRMRLHYRIASGVVQAENGESVVVL